jgi:hypothetical protein
VCSRLQKKILDATNAKVCGKGIAIILDVVGRCCSKELQNSKMKKAKTKFPVDKSKATKTKNKHFSQDKGCN